MSLNEKQRRHLKGLAHHLKPVVIIGQHGLSSGVVDELKSRLNTHELIKVRLNAADRLSRVEMVQTICRESNAELIQTIGHIGVFYRRHPENPKLQLPK